MLPAPRRPEVNTPAELMRTAPTYRDYAVRLLENSQQCPQFILDQCRARDGACVPCDVEAALSRAAVRPGRRSVAQTAPKASQPARAVASGASVNRSPGWRGLPI